MCGSDYAPALEAFADAIRAELHPSCLPSCAADTDSTQAGLQPDCRVHRVVRDAEGSVIESELPVCSDGVIPDGADGCVRFVTGADLSPVCVEEGWNLEFELIPRPGTYVDGAQIAASCARSQDRSVDCPDLP